MGRRNRALALDTRAMVNVDFSPALLLGMSLIAGGLALYQLRRLQPDISRDFDVIVSAVATFSGGILIFQVRVQASRRAWTGIACHSSCGSTILSDGSDLLLV